MSFSRILNSQTQIKGEKKTSGSSGGWGRKVKEPPIRQRKGTGIAMTAINGCHFVMSEEREMIAPVKKWV